MTKDTARTLQMNSKLANDPGLLVRLVEARILTPNEARAALNLLPKGIA